MKKCDLEGLCKYEGIPLGGKKVDLEQKMLSHIAKLKDNEAAAYSGVYTPEKYFAGLTPKEAAIRLKEIRKGAKTRSDDPSAYKPFTTDYRNGKKIPTKASQYTIAFLEKFGEMKTLEEKSKATGIPLDVLQRVWDKGLAAWRTGHRPGATQSQWAAARVNSFIMKGCTFYFPDHVLVEEATQRSKKAKEHWDSIKCICPKSCQLGKK